MKFSQNLWQSYNLYKRRRAVYGILDENVWNMDEHGMGLGLLSGFQALARLEKSIYYTLPGWPSKFLFGSRDLTSFFFHCRESLR